MGQIVRECETSDGRPLGWMVFCPACGSGHLFDKGRWTFDGDHERPTFNPSMLIRTVRLPDLAPGEADYAKGPDGKYLLDETGRIRGARDWVCHSFVRDGQIQYLDDCTHDLKGQTVPLPEF